MSSAKLVKNTSDCNLNFTLPVLKTLLSLKHNRKVSVTRKVKLITQESDVPPTRMNIFEPPFDLLLLSQTLVKMGKNGHQTFSNRLLRGGIACVVRETETESIYCIYLFFIIYFFNFKAIHSGVTFVHIFSYFIFVLHRYPECG